MKSLEKDIRSIKSDCRIIRLLLFAIIGGFIGFVCGTRPTNPKTHHARNDSNNNTLHNSAERRLEMAQNVFDSIPASLTPTSAKQPF